MKQRMMMLAATIGIGSLAACGGGNGDTPASDSVLALHEAQIDHVDVATQLVPLRHLGKLSQPVATTRAATTDATCPSSSASSAPLTLSVADLEADYETKFCQLNATYGVSLNSGPCLANIAYIKGQAGTGNFDLSAQPVARNALGVTGVRFQAVNYSTTVSLPQGQKTFQVSGGLMMPQGIPASKLKGVVTYFHGTSFNKCMVGSNYTDNGETRLVAEVFASQGYVVLIPDYVGQGIDYNDVHPYVIYPQVSAKTAVDMLAAVAPTLRTQYSLDSGTQLKLFSAGYSEGGAYSVWFAVFLNDQPTVLDALYQFKHAVGMEGAYSTSNVTKGYLFDNVAAGGSNTYNIQTQAVTNFVKPLLAADAFLSYATYQLAGDVNSVFNTDFYAMKCALLLSQSSCNVNGSNVNIANAFAQANLTVAQPILFSAFSKSANGSTYPGRVELTSSTKNSVNSLVSPTLLSNAGQAQLVAALKAADVDLSRLPDRSVSIVSLSQDSVVTPNNYNWLLQTYRTKIRDYYLIPADQIQVVSLVSYDVGKTPRYVDVDHLQGPVYEFLYALNTFNQF